MKAPHYTHTPMFSVLLLLVLPSFSCSANGTGAVQPSGADADDAPQGSAESLAPKESAPPQATIASEHLKVHFYLPDSKTGFYRGTRFDWSGMIHRVDYGEHHFYGTWYPTRSPTGHDQNSVGPCEEFGMAEPLGYSEARPGETFVKIGVGHLEKLDDKKYTFDGKYPLRRPGAWSIHRARDHIRFRQEVEDERGWGYRYTKTVQLEPAAPAFVIKHKLENTGRRDIDTDFYNHNFTSIDGKSVDGDHRLEFAFDFKPRRSLPAVAEVRKRSLRFTGDLTTPFFTEIDGLAVAPTDGNFTIENVASGAGVRVTGDRTPFKVNFYAAPRAICPEAFLRLQVGVGKSLEWEIRYEFYAR